MLRKEINHFSSSCPFFLNFSPSFFTVCVLHDVFEEGNGYNIFPTPFRTYGQEVIRSEEESEPLSPSNHLKFLTLIDDGRKKQKKQCCCLPCRRTVSFDDTGPVLVPLLTVQPLLLLLLVAAGW